MSCCVVCGWEYPSILHVSQITWKNPFEIDIACSKCRGWAQPFVKKEEVLRRNECPATRNNVRF